MFVLSHVSNGQGPHHHGQQQKNPAAGHGQGRDHHRDDEDKGRGHDDHDDHKGNGKPKDDDHSPPHVKGCPQLETIARNITWTRVAADPTLAPKLLRLHFHDCFVRGCDASILLDSTASNSAEKDAIPNQTVAGYEVIDEIKARLEVVCPSSVSCADIVALAARDAMIQFKRPMWPVSIGRKDGRVSSSSEASANLPSPFSNFTTLLQDFKNKGLDLQDLVALSGAHTIGVGHCGLISDRLFNFTGVGDTDPSIARVYASLLRAKCSNLGANNNVVDPAIEMDPGSGSSFDTHYYTALRQNQGLFESDAALLTDQRSARMSRVFETNRELFFVAFGQSMVKMGAIGGVGAGEIRKNCHVIN
ncbi:unnamed protein product [Linum tenue]|uniref:Peroxidase n=2 Tax=Linum tenue TaxID=586396 RepID=A0AAV0P7M0_9ROSI|nr:unnamed protein product [Linum tenue]